VPRDATTLFERREFLEKAAGVRVSDSTVSRTQAHGLQLKSSLGAVEREEFLRCAWLTMLAGAVDAERLMFVDEMGANTSLWPLYPWSPRGERARAGVPPNRGKNTTLLASMGVEGMGHCLPAEGFTTATVFETYIERVRAKLAVWAACDDG
jgi:hypothetical protein